MCLEKVGLVATHIPASRGYTLGQTAYLTGGSEAQVRIREHPKHGRGAEIPAKFHEGATHLYKGSPRIVSIQMFLRSNRLIVHHQPCPEDGQRKSVSHFAPYLEHCSTTTILLRLFWQRVGLNT